MQHIYTHHYYLVYAHIYGHKGSRATQASTAWREREREREREVKSIKISHMIQLSIAHLHIRTTNTDTIRNESS